MISRFVGAILLQFLKPIFFLVFTTILALLGILLIIFSTTGLIAQIAIFIVGLGAGNLFPLVFSIAINGMPSRSNEISGLLIMAIVGGALIPPLMGVVSNSMGVVSSLIIIALCFLYILLIPFIKSNTQSYLTEK